jgi:universal stress protein E
MDKRKFLVVVDPSHESHLALDRMIHIIRQREERQIEVHLFIGFEQDDRSNPDVPEEVIVGREWRRELLRPLNELETEYTAEFFWTRHWRRSIVDAAARYDCDVIMLSRSSAENKRGIADSKWDLVRRADCEVVIVGHSVKGPLRSIVAAVNTESESDEDRLLNEKVLHRGKFLSDFYKADFHVVNSYKGTEDFPDRDAITRLIDIPKERILVDMGAPQDVIAKFAKQVSADMVIIGTKSRHGLGGLFKGNTNERLLDQLLDIDVLAVHLGAE